MLAVLFVSFFIIQLAFPWRYLLMPGELFWTEEGYRFSWRVMLMEKMGDAQFIVKDAVTGKQVAVNNNDFLTKNQEKMMATQTDFIIQYAGLLASYYKNQGMEQPRVYASVYVSLNGRRSRLYIDPGKNLAGLREDFKHKDWITPFTGTIYGL